MVDFNDEVDDTFDFGGDEDMPSSDFEVKVLARLDTIAAMLTIIAENKPAQPAPVQHVAAPAGPPTQGAELVTILSVDTKPITGQHGTSLRYGVKFARQDGTQAGASTFKAPIGAAAIPLAGKQAYIVVQPGRNPQYLDLMSVQAA